MLTCHFNGLGQGLKPLLAAVDAVLTCGSLTQLASCCGCPQAEEGEQHCFHCIAGCIQLPAPSSWAHADGWWYAEAEKLTQQMLDQQPASFSRDSPRAVQELLVQRLRACLRVVLGCTAQAQAAQLQRFPGTGLLACCQHGVLPVQHSALSTTRTTGHLSYAYPSALSLTRAWCAGLARLPVLVVPALGSDALTEVIMATLSGCADSETEHQAAKVSAPKQLEMLPHIASASTGYVTTLWFSPTATQS